MLDGKEIEHAQKRLQPRPLGRMRKSWRKGNGEGTKVTKMVDHEIVNLTGDFKLF